MVPRRGGGEVHDAVDDVGLRTEEERRLLLAVSLREEEEQVYGAR